MNLQTLQQESDKELWSLLYDEYGDVGKNGNMQSFLHLQLEKAYTLGLRKGVEMVEEKVPANKDFLWENGECSVCGYDSYHNEGTEHYCDICNTYRTEILTSINKIKELLK